MNGRSTRRRRIRGTWPRWFATLAAGGRHAAEIHAGEVLFTTQSNGTVNN
jgi:hypothetical protein